MKSIFSNKTLQGLSKELKATVHSKEEILETFCSGLKSAYGFSSVSIYLLDSTSNQITATFPSEKTVWPLPETEKTWFVTTIKDKLIKNETEGPFRVIYIPDKAKVLFTDKIQLGKDQKAFPTTHWEGLYVALLSEDEVVFGIACIHNWEKKHPLFHKLEASVVMKDIDLFTKEISTALDNYFIHQKIESLLSDKQHLKQRIQKDEEDLKRRILELSVLYDSSNALGYSLNYAQMVQMVMESLYKVLNFDVCSILLLDFIPGGEIITRVNTPAHADFVKSVQSNIISATIPFLRYPLETQKVKLTTENRFKSRGEPLQKNHMKSFANVPLIFKEEVIGMLNVCSALENIFGRNEMTFLHTMANQLASHLGRLKTVRSLEKSKIGSLIFGMTEGVVMFNEEGDLELINPAAMVALGLDPKRKVTLEKVRDIFIEIKVWDLFNSAVESEKAILNQEITCENRALVVNITMVKDSNGHRVGTVLVFKDFTELQRVNKVKSQRLEVISKLNLIIKSITDLDNLLMVIIEFVLNIADSEMGSIQLKKGKTFFTHVHSNFPDKIRRAYKFKSGETISEHVARTHELCFIDHYPHNKKVSPSTKILLESYICIPIMIKNEVIGIINIARKEGFSAQTLNQDDIDTLSTITALVGTAIHNAMLYLETLEKQKLDQELRVANEIQTKLLPEKLPVLDAINFGAISVPAREIGGDYYDFFYLDNGDIGIVLADIVGKGVPAGLFMAMLKSILHTHLLSIFSPQEALEKINALLYKDPVINKFVPVFYGILNPKTLSFRYCNAGHEPAILFSSQKITVLDTNGFPLGSIPDSDYQEKEIILTDQDIILCFTDGVVESRNTKGQNFGRRHLEQFVKKNSHLNATELVHKIFAHIQKNSQAKQHDDLTIVGIKVDFKAKEKLELEAPLSVKKTSVVSAKKYIKQIRKEAEEIATGMGFDEEAIYNIKLAVNEAHANVIEHAYFGKEDGEIVVQFRVFRDRLEIMIKDFGPGMRQKATKGKEHLEELEGSGLGVFLMNTYMDKVEYRQTSRIGTELWMTKFLKGAK